MTPDDVYFSEWTPWHLRDRIDPIDDTPTDFGLSGIYLLAHFNDPQKAKKSFKRFHLNPDVIYIGVSRSANPQIRQISQNGCSIQINVSRFITFQALLFRLAE